MFMSLLLCVDVESGVSVDCSTLTRLFDERGPIYSLDMPVGQGLGVGEVGFWISGDVLFVRFSAGFGDT